MTTIANKTALAIVAANQAVLVDVREPAEFWEGHLPGAVNLASTSFQIEDYQLFKHKAIFLVCNSGSRAEQIRDRLQEQNFQNVLLLEQQMDTLNEATTIAQGESFTASTGWSIDRQFRLTLGLMLLVFLLGYSLLSALFIIIPIIWYCPSFSLMDFFQQGEQGFEL